MLQFIFAHNLSIHKMEHETYQVLYQAHMGNVNRDALNKILQTEKDPFLIYYINLMLEKSSIQVDWDITPFTESFRSTSPEERLQETILAFLLRIAALVKEEMYIRTFNKPEAQIAFLAWVQILNQCIYTVLTLLYDLKWEDVDHFKRDDAVLNLLHYGKATALRELMEHMGIRMIKPLYPAEKMFEKLNFLRTDQFSSFYWRLLHWMAEAMNKRKNRPNVQKMWRDLVRYPLYRTLRCGICMYHFQKLTKEMEAQLADEEQDNAKLWFDIHNKVHASRREQYPFLIEPDYTEDEYKLDAEFMQRGIK